MLDEAARGTIGARRWQRLASREDPSHLTMTRGARNMSLG